MDKKVNRKNYINHAIYSTVISILMGLSTASILIFGKSILPINDAMIICSKGMIKQESSKMVYKCLIILFIFILPLQILIYTNFKIINFVSQ